MRYAETPQRHSIRDGRFVCEEEPTARCHNYPACDCEAWTRELHGQRFGQPIGVAPSGHTLYADSAVPPEPGHEDVPQDECWIDPWLNAFDLGDTYEDPDDGLAYDIGFTFPDGPVVAEWSGDVEGVVWHYADDTRPVAEEDE